MRFIAAFLCWLIALPAAAFTPGQQVALLRPQIAPINGYTAPYFFNFARGGNPISNGTCATYGHVVPCITTTTRASVGYVNDAGGNWTLVPAATGTPAYGAAGGARISNLGLLPEEARTNSLRNNSMQGAVAGTPGTLPTNWVTATLNGLTQTIVGTGTQNGIDYIDIRYAGTPTAAGTTSSLSFDAPTQIAANNTTLSVWGNSAFVALVSGSLTNMTSFSLLARMRDGGGSSAGAITTANLASVNSTLTRYPTSGAATTLTAATTAFVQSQITWVNTDNITPVDFTLRVGWPQLELGASVSSPIRTTTVAVARAADVVTMTTPPTFGSAYSLYAKGSLQSLITAVSAQMMISADDGTINNRSILALYWQSIAASRALTASTGGGAAGGSIGLVLPVVNTSYKLASGFALNDFAAVKNGGTIGTDSSADISVGVNSVGFGGGAGNFPLNGFLAEAAIWASQRVPNGQLQTMTVGR